MIKRFLLCVLLLGVFVLTGCNPEPKITFQSEVANIQFIVRSWNAPDIIQVTFQDGHVLFISQSAIMQFQIEHEYIITTTSSGKLIKVTEIIRKKE